ARPLAQRVRAHERLELSDHESVAAERELGLDALLDRAEAKLLEPPDLALAEDRVRELRQRLATPELERAPQEADALLRLRRAGLRDKPLEALDVDGLGREVEHVAGGPRHEHVRPEQLPQLRNEVLEGGCGRSRRLRAPE